MNKLTGKIKNVEQHFDEIAEAWDLRYDSIHSIADYELWRRRELVLSALDRYLPDQAQVIDIGCGSGRVLSKAIEDHETWQGVGLDISQKMVDLCRKNYRDNPRLSFQQHNLLNAPLNIQADAAIAMGVFGYLDDPKIGIASVNQMLKPGGYLMFTVNKPSLPRLITFLTRAVIITFTQRHYVPRRNRGYALSTVRNWLGAEYEILETYDYCYAPYTPGLNRLIGISRGLERIFGRRPTILSSTTMLICRRRS